MIKDLMLNILSSFFKDKKKGFYFQDYLKDFSERFQRIPFVVEHFSRIP